MTGYLRRRLGFMAHFFAPLTLFCFCGGNRVGELLQLGHEEAVHVVRVRVETAREAKRGMEPPLFEPEHENIVVSFENAEPILLWMAYTTRHIVEYSTWWSLLCQSLVQREPIWRFFSSERSRRPTRSLPPAGTHLDVIHTFRHISQVCCFTASWRWNRLRTSNSNL